MFLTGKILPIFFRLFSANSCYSTGYCPSGGGHCRSDNILIRFNHNLSVIESTEIPSLASHDSEIIFLESGVVATLSGAAGTQYSSTNPDEALARYRHPGQQWVIIPKNHTSAYCEGHLTNLIPLDGERFAWSCMEHITSASSNWVLNIENVTSGNSVKHILGTYTDAGGAPLQRGGIALAHDQILLALDLGSYSITILDGSVYYGRNAFHVDLNTMNVTLPPGGLRNLLFRTQPGNPVRVSGHLSVS